MKLIINKDRTTVAVGTWGTVNENDYEILDFEFPAELDEYNKRIVYYLGDERVWDAIVNNKAYITNAITTKGDVKAYVWCTKENTEREADTDFRTMLFDMHFYENDNADGIVPTEEQVDGFNTMLTAMNAKIDEVDALETTIETAEAQRQEAEATRVSNENTRETNESTRQTNEQTRQSQEAERERRTDEAISQITDMTEAYNQNAQEKIADFDTYVDAAEQSILGAGNYQVNRVNNVGNTNRTAIQQTAGTALNSIVQAREAGVSAVETASSEATTNFNTNATNKTNAFNDNATSKTNDFNNNATEKTDDFNTNARNKIDEYDEHIVEYQAQIDELQEEVDELSENMPWNTTEQATEISVDDAAKYSRNKLELFGNTEQPFVLPPNYTPLDYIESTGTQYIDTGIGTSNTIKVEAEVINTFGFQRAGRIYGGALFGGRKSSTNSNFSYVTGDVHDYVGKGNNFIEIDKNVNTDLLKIQYDTSSVNIECGNYEYINNNLSINITNSFNIYIFANNQDNTIASYGTFKLYKFKIYDNDTLVRDFVPCKNENNEGGLFDLVSNTFFSNQGTGTFTLGNKIKTIHVVTGENTIEVQGINIFDGILENGTVDYSTGINAISTTGIVRSKNYIPISSSFTIITKTPFNSAHTIGWRYYDKDYNYIGRGSTYLTNYAAVTPNNSLDNTKTVAYMRFIDSSANEDITEEFCIRTDSSTDYVPYYHADYPINLGSLELCKIGNYQDYLYKENGNWYKYGAIGKVICDGTENWNMPNSSSYPHLFQVNDVDLDFVNQDNNAISNYFIWRISLSKMDGFRLLVSSNRKYLRINHLGITSVANFKTWLSTHNIDIYYQVTTPISTQITDTTLISQLDAIYEHLQLVKGTNNITVTAEDLAPHMELTYMQDLPSKLDNLDSRLSLLE